MRGVRGRRQISAGLLAALAALLAAAVTVAAAHHRSVVSDGDVPATIDKGPVPTPIFHAPPRSLSDPTLPPAPPAVQPAAPADTGAVLALQSAHPYPGHPLKYGSRGPAVREVQKALGITVDGWFGSQTVHAVKQFQQTHGLKVDGIVGPVTWKALFG
jgi:hypothetical protein